MSDLRLRRLPVWLVACALMAPAAGAWSEPAAIAPSGSLRQKAERSFEDFAKTWIRDLRTQEAKARKAGKAHAGPGGEWRVELRPTGKPRIPYVGILHYTENRMQCSGAGKCRATGSGGVSEIFRFQNGKWVY